MWIEGFQASILYMGNYIYAKDEKSNVIYRLPYTKHKVVTDDNTSIEAIVVDCGENKTLEGGV